MNEYLEFAEWLQEQDKADKTVSTYIYVLNKFVTWHEQSEGKAFDPQDVTVVAIQDYRSI